METRPDDPTPPEPRAAECEHPTYRPDMPGPGKEFFCETCGAQLHKTELHGRINLGVKFQS